MPAFPYASLGYSRQQVDAFVARIKGTLGRSPLYAPPVTPDEVATVRFARAVRGYQMKAVDDALEKYLHDLEDKDGRTRIPRGEADQLIGLVRNVQFGTTRLSLGYNEQEVDAFLDRMIIALRDNRARPSDVKSVVFATTRMRTGYCQPDVDAFLERLASEIDRLRTGG